MPVSLVERSLLILMEAGAVTVVVRSQARTLPRLIDLGLMLLDGLLNRWCLMGTVRELLCKFRTVLE